jgi:hypothetical protein
MLLRTNCEKQILLATLNGIAMDLLLIFYRFAFEFFLNFYLFLKDPKKGSKDCRF